MFILIQIDIYIYEKKKLKHKQVLKMNIGDASANLMEEINNI